MGQPWGQPWRQPLGQPWGQPWGKPWMQTLDRKKSYLNCFLDSNPGQIDDCHEMRLFSLPIYIRKISNVTIEIQRLKKKLRRPLLDYQDREMLRIGFITCVNRRYLVRDYHSVRYPVRQTTENRSWSVSYQWFSCLTLSSEYLVGFCYNSYCAYYDSRVEILCSTTFVDFLVIRTRT